MTHTPTPWTVSENDATKIYGNRNDQPYSYMVADTYGYKDEREANAAFIVRACNNHNQLVNLLELCEPFIRDSKGAHIIHADLMIALAAARGEA